MPADWRVDVENLADVARALKKAGQEDVPKAIKAANKDAAAIVVDDALPHVPVGATGDLKRSVRALAGVKDARVAAGGARVAHAGPIHWGVGARSGERGPHNITGRPFLFDAAVRMRDRVEDAYATAIEQILEDFA